ncbi:MAG TPA: hypothetical protein VMN36_00550 [Verrucomicrobiales bacterium]|nr:hypothetical protein [Verrucomicrobiales bacterium]
MEPAAPEPSGRHSQPEDKGAETAERLKGSRGDRQPAQPPRPTPYHDPEDLARKAWQIYSAEIAEDGVTLFDDKDASNLARRAFRLAQVFLDAQHQHFSRGPRRENHGPSNGPGHRSPPRPSGETPPQS